MNHKAKVVSILLLTILCLVAFASNSIAVDYLGMNQSKPEPFIIKGIVTIQFEDNIDLEFSNKMQRGFGAVSFNLPSLDNLFDKYQVVQAKKIFPIENSKPEINSGMVDLTRYYELTFSEDLDVNQVVAELSQNPNLRMAEPVWAMVLDAAPNDPEWMTQWAMAPAGPDGNFYSAWDYETGSDSIKVAIIDSGVLYSHRDLSGNIWVNPGEDLDGDGIVFDDDDINGIDDDGNGLIDDFVGYDFYTGAGSGTWPGEDGSVRDNDPLDFDGHGTHVSGITAAMNNNGIDVTGGAGGWFGGHRSFRGVRIICLRAGGIAADGKTYLNSNDLASAINYAVSVGAHVINASWGGGSSSLPSTAAANAVAAGVTVCHSAGNDNQNNPSGLDLVDGVINIASTGPHTDIKSGFSNYGQWVDVSAPGSSILSTFSDFYSPDIATLGGTSMSSPMVAGLACLIRSQMPSLTKDQVDSIIINTADSLALYTANPLFQGNLGSGRIDALAALIDLANAKFTSDVTDGSVPLTVNFTDLSPNSPVGWDWSFGNGDVSTDQNPQNVYNQPGLYDVSLIIDENNPLGPGEEHLKKYIWVRQDSMLGDSVETPFGTEVVVPVYLNNTTPVKEIQYVFSYDNTFAVNFDSFSVAGTRTEYFEKVIYNAYDAWNGRASILMQTHTIVGSNYLPPDTGAILNLFFTVVGNGSKGVVVIDTTSFNGKSSNVKSIYGDYFPSGYEPVKINVSGCCIGFRGNFTNDENDDIDISDLIQMVAYMFQGGAEPECFEEADINGSGGAIDISDLILMVAYMFQEGDEPASCY